MLFERDNLHAARAWISQRARGETHVTRKFFRTARDRRVHERSYLTLRLGRVLVADVRAPDTREFQSLGAHGAFHHVAALTLLVIKAGVGNDGDAREIRGVIRGVVELPERLLPRGKLRAVRAELLVLRRLREARARRDHRPHAGMMRAQMPRARATHREAAQREAAVIDAIRFLHLRQRLEDIRLARELEGVAVATVGMQDQRVGGRELAKRLHAVGDEFQLSEIIVAPVQPHIEAARRGSIRGEGCGNDETEGLHRAVNFGNVAAHHEAGGGEPRGLALAQLVRALHAGLEQRAGEADFVAAVELVVAQRPVHGFVENFHVRQQLALRRRAQRLNLLRQRVRTCAQGNAILLGDGESGRRHARGLGLRGSGEQRGREQQDKGESFHARFFICHSIQTISSWKAFLVG